MAENIAELVDQAIQPVPEDAREEVRTWVERAQAGNESTVEQGLLREAKEACDVFERAAREVEKKLQK